MNIIVVYINQREWSITVGAWVTQRRGNMCLNCGQISSNTGQGHREFCADLWLALGDNAAAVCAGDGGGFQQHGLLIADTRGQAKQLLLGDKQFFAPAPADVIGSQRPGLLRLSYLLDLRGREPCVLAERIIASRTGGAERFSVS